MTIATSTSRDSVGGKSTDGRPCIATTGKSPRVQVTAGVAARWPARCRSRAGRRHDVVAYPFFSVAPSIHGERRRRASVRTKRRAPRQPALRISPAGTPTGQSQISPMDIRISQARLPHRVYARHAAAAMTLLERRSNHRSPRDVRVGRRESLRSRIAKRTSMSADILLCCAPAAASDCQAAAEQCLTQVRRAKAEREAALCFGQLLELLPRDPWRPYAPMNEY